MSEDNENVVIEMKPSTDEAAKASVSIDIKDKSEEITPSTGMYVCMYIRIYVCMYICMYVCMYVQAVKKENGVAKQDEEKKDDAKQTATANVCMYVGDTCFHKYTNTYIHTYIHT